jgi:hypothetical protein
LVRLGQIALADRIESNEERIAVIAVAPATQVRWIERTEKRALTRATVPLPRDDVPRRSWELGPG